uniref:Recep_L_domain domain-containing protein n=1 Tax=Caenorhabditis tropicalis TaxID=1561998 RepID=A0A1I7UYH5_9PELO
MHGFRERDDGEKACLFDDLSSMESGCQHLIGDVLIDSKNEKYTWKLENVTNIYGELAVLGTVELTNVSFLSNLRHVAVLNWDGQTLIRFNGNKRLEQLFLPKMRNRPFPYPDGINGIIEIKDNEMEIFKSQRDCLLFQKLAQTSIKYNMKSCDKLPKAEVTTPKTIETTTKEPEETASKVIETTTQKVEETTVIIDTLESEEEELIENTERPEETTVINVATEPTVTTTKTGSRFFNFFLFLNGFLFFL